MQHRWLPARRCVKKIKLKQPNYHFYLQFYLGKSRYSFCVLVRLPKNASAQNQIVFIEGDLKLMRPLKQVANLLIFLRVVQKSEAKLKPCSYFRVSRTTEFTWCYRKVRCISLSSLYNQKELQFLPRRRYQLLVWKWKHARLLHFLCHPHICHANGCKIFPRKHTIGFAVVVDSPLCLPNSVLTNILILVGHYYFLTWITFEFLRPWLDDKSMRMRSSVRETKSVLPDLMRFSWMLSFPDWRKASGN